MEYIQLKKLNYTYPGECKKSLSNINLEIAKGEILLITGESGSGKSTLAKCIAGSAPNFYGGTISGGIKISGKPSMEMSSLERAKEITMVFQDPERQLVMNSVHREVAFGLQNIGIEERQIKRRVWEALQFTNILDLTYRNVSTLSGGQKQKVAIASAIAYFPRCIILDEPASQLDPSSAEEIVSLVKKINEELGITIIVIEQRINRWFGIADRAAVMKDGTLAFDGSLEKLYSQNDEYLTGFLPAGLKLSKGLGILDMPYGFKDIRKKVSLFDFKESLKKDNSIDCGEEIINIKNLCCKYEDVVAIKDLSLKVFKGEFLGILGANGAGKSTLLKSITGLVKYAGSIKVNGNEVKKVKLKDIARICGYVSQNPNDYISKDSVYDELKFTLDNFGMKDTKIIDETLKKLDIEALRDKNPRDLSGGERQRAAIASILVMEPEILLIDEPTRGLDLNIKKKLGETLQELNRGGTTILLVTHDVEFAAEYCRRFILMFDGEAAADGDREEVLGGGIYYTTDINKLVMDKNSSVFTLNEALNCAGRIVN